ncbi:MAG TPA: aminotransferase class V-fold PLP-dependent enzyme [Pyrinomonadaceae bacterium]|nr:aminotransferase class V-fold PLP-dependent enzyme [Pyrinomonadaceae bacterium]
MNESIRNLFIAARNYTYLNSAAVSPLPETAVKAVIDQMIDVSAHGSIGYLGWLEHKESARTLLAGMMNVQPEQVAFTRNTSDGIATIANGLDWAEGDNIVSFENEFPANFYPWRRIRDEYGVELRLCPEREGRIDLDEFCSLIDSNTKVVAISAVQYASGFKADLERIGRAAREVDALFVVDVIQGLGAMAFDLPAQYVDVASGASHKWLCAPEGCGFVYLSDRAREMVKPTLVGWISVETPWDFVDKEQPWRPNALAWESGTGTSSLFYGLEQSLKLLTDTGLARVEKYVNGLADQLCDGLAGRDYDIVSSRAPGEKTSIVCIRHRNGHTASDIASTLEAQKIIVSPRGDRLRIAAHFYNNSEDIDRLLKALP